MEDEERIEEERHYREAIAAKLAGLGREPTPADLAELGVRPMRTGQGIFRDHDRTRAIAPPHGVTLSLLDVGGVYADAFDDDGGIYHYPTTGRGERDVAEIEATKNACRLGLPVFVVLAGQAPDTRDVRVGYVERWDDESRTCFIGFGRRPGSLATSDDAPFELEGPNRLRVQSTRSARPGQNRFRFGVLLRYGSACAFCGLRCEPLLDAIHLRPVEAKGSDDPRNGLPACPTHHRAFDLGLIWIHPETLAVESGRDARDLGVRLASIQHLPAQPHVDALRWAFERVKGRKGTS